MIQDKNDPETAKGIDKYLHQSTLDFLSHLENYQNDSREIFIQSLIKLLDNIITNPYVDKYRLIDPDYQSEPIIYKQAFLAGFFKRVGFIEEKTGKQQIFYYPYNAPIPALITVQMTLKDFGKLTGIQGDVIDIREMTAFENFLKLRNFLTSDLLKKEAKPERIALGLNLDELRIIFAESNIKTIRQLLVCYKQNSEELEETLLRIVTPKKRAQHVLSILKEFWNELEFLRTTAFYIYSCFADKVSCSFLNDTNDSHSQIARRILSLSILQAQTLIKINRGTFLNLRDLLLEYMRWYCLNNEDPSHEEFTEQIGKGLLGSNKVHDFLENLDLILCERVTQQDKTRSIRLRSDNYRSWCISQPLLFETSQNVNFSKDLDKWFHTDIINDYYYMTFATQLLSVQYGFKVTFDRLAINKFLFEPSKPESDFFSKDGSLENQKKQNFKTPNLENFSKLLYKGLVPANLYASVVNQHFEILKELLNNGVHLNLRDHKNRSLLHYAAFMGYTEIATFLIQKGIDINAEDDLGKTPFDIAFENNHYNGDSNVCAVLIKHGVPASLKIWDSLIEIALKTDSTVFLDLALKQDIPFIASLHAEILKIPIKHKSAKVLKFLYEKADHDTIKKLALHRDTEDKNALDYAFEAQNEEIISLVEKIIGNEFISTFPEIIKNQESQIDYNQQVLNSNLKQLKDVDESNRLANLGMKTEAGNLLPSTLMMLSHGPEPFEVSSSDTYEKFIRNSSPTSESPHLQQNFRPFKKYGSANSSIGGGENESGGYMGAQISFNKFLREPVPPKPRERDDSSKKNPNFRNRGVKYPAIETRLDSLDYSNFEEGDQGSKSLIYEKKKLPPLPKSSSINFDRNSAGIPSHQEKNLTPMRSRADPVEDFSKQSPYYKDQEKILTEMRLRVVEPEEEISKQNPFSKDSAQEKNLTPMRSRAEFGEEIPLQKPFSNPKGYVKPEPPSNFSSDRYIKDLENLLKVATQRRIEEEERLREQQAKDCAIS